MCIHVFDGSELWPTLWLNGAYMFTYDNSEFKHFFTNVTSKVQYCVTRIPLKTGV